MATATASASVEEHPRVIAAYEVVRPLHERRRAIDAESNAAFAASGQNNVFSHEFAPVDEAERIRAQFRLRQLAVELDELRLLEIPAERELRDARAVARQELADGILARQRPALAALDRALREAAKQNAVVAGLDDELEAVAGAGSPRFSWHELLAESSSLDTRIAAWRRSCREHGVL